MQLLNREHGAPPFLGVKPQQSDHGRKKSWHPKFGKKGKHKMGEHVGKTGKAMPAIQEVTSFV